MDLNLKERQKIEALERMILLKLHSNAIKEFEEDGKINKSEIAGFLYWLNDDEKKMIREWEEETGNLAYHAILSNTAFGQMLSIFYVSRHEDEWEMDKEDIPQNRAVVYVKNLDNELFSEYGSIFFKKNMGGLVRIA